MSKDEHPQPEEDAGAYGTPALGEDRPPADGQRAQLRRDEAIEAAGLDQSAADGETYPAGAPDLSQMAGEDADSAGEPGAGRFGGVDDQWKAEADLGPDIGDETESGEEAQ